LTKVFDAGLHGQKTLTKFLIENFDRQIIKTRFWYCRIFGHINLNWWMNEKKSI
jgi:hypothetical protein